MTALPLFGRPTAVYRLFDHCSALLYVGIGSEPKHRLKAHKAHKPWWREVAQTAIEWHDDRLAALKHEALAIATEHPRYNLVRPRPTGVRLPESTVGDRHRLTYEEAASGAGITDRWLRQMVRDGKVQPTVIGGRVFFDPSALDHIRQVRLEWFIARAVAKTRKAHAVQAGFTDADIARAIRKTRGRRR